MLGGGVLEVGGDRDGGGVLDGWGNRDGGGGWVLEVVGVVGW